MAENETIAVPDPEAVEAQVRNQAVVDENAGQPLGVVMPKVVSNPKAVKAQERNQAVVENQD